MPSYPTRLVAYPPEEESLKREVMTHFGHRCVCPGCGETALRLLHLDHKNGGGSQERRQMKRRGTSFYREVKTAIDRDASTDRTWLATLQILCLDCNLSKGSGDACRLGHVNQENIFETQEDTDGVTSEEPEDFTPSNTSDANDPLERLSTRLPRSIKKLLMAQGDANVGQTITKLVQESQSTAPMVLAELRAFMTYQRQVNGDLLTLLSDLALKGSDSDLRADEVLDPFPHRRPDYVPPDEVERLPASLPPTPRRWSLFRGRT